MTQPATPLSICPREQSWCSGPMLAAWALALLAALVYPAVLGIHVIDDSFIAYRYARNLLNHGELVFN